MLRWRFLRYIRCPPAASAYLTEGPFSPPSTSKDIRILPYSSLDLYIQRFCPQEAATYRRKVTELFLAQRFAVGFPAIVAVFDLAFRAGLILLSTKITTSLALPVGFAAHTLLLALAQTIITVFTCNAVHIWAIIKGF